MEEAADAMKRSYDSSKQPSRVYEKGQLVWLDTRNLKMDWPNKKLDNKCTRPFVVVEKVGPAGYKLNLPQAWHIHNVFNELLLTPYNAPEFPTQEVRPPPPPPIIDDNHLEYEVEAILDMKKVRCRVRYLVKWLGYPTKENTWEP